MVGSGSGVDGILNISGVLGVPALEQEVTLKWVSCSGRSECEGGELPSSPCLARRSRITCLEHYR